MEGMTCGVFLALLVVTCVQSLSMQPVEPAETSPVRPFPFPRCGPVCMIHCPFGNVMDSRGCPTCSCRDKPVCPLLKCLRHCPNGYTTVDGCRTCQCRDERRTCSDLPLCRRFCPNGFMKDANGCTLCQCKPEELITLRPPVCPLVLCAKPCRNGYVKKNGCQTCQCRNGPVRPQCGPQCRMACPNGFVEDSRGCPICKCKSVAPRPVRPQCGPQCRLGCPNGFVEDSRGCPICKCKSVAPRSCRRQCLSYCLRSVLRRRNPPSGCDCNCNSYRRLSPMRSRTY